MRIDLGSDDRVIELPYVNVSDGLWHTARMRRWGNQAVLQLDGGDGRYALLRPVYTKQKQTRMHHRF